jgi:hypothetical protein
MGSHLYNFAGHEILIFSGPINSRQNEIIKAMLMRSLLIVVEKTQLVDFG